MSDCIFCKIINGEIPALKVYEDKHTLAFLDIEPVSIGHTLVIPKGHSDNLNELPEEMICPLFETVKKVSKALTEAIGPNDYNVVINVGKDAGQEIHHTHVHVIPRESDDGLQRWPKVEVTEEQMDRAAEKIRMAAQA
ncbi:MAG: HIT family protein [Patescibacteria group bacterium]|nr:HIT family protein [Patescibacteria group bacterium]